MQRKVVKIDLISGLQKMRSIYRTHCVE